MPAPVLPIRDYKNVPGDRSWFWFPSEMAFYVFGDLCIDDHDSDALEQWMQEREQFMRNGTPQHECVHSCLDDFVPALREEFLRAGCGVDEIATLVAQHRNCGDQMARAWVLERLTDPRFTGVNPVEYAILIQEFMEERLFLLAMNEAWTPVLASNHLLSRYRSISLDYKLDIVRRAHRLCCARKKWFAAEDGLKEWQAAMQDLAGFVTTESHNTIWPPLVLVATGDFSLPQVELEALARACLHCKLDMMAVFCDGIRSVPPVNATTALG
jgi:hypothetical protein